MQPVTRSRVAVCIDAFLAHSVLMVEVWHGAAPGIASGGEAALAKEARIT